MLPLSASSVLIIPSGVHPRDDCATKEQPERFQKGDKMKPRWLGPYTVHEALDKGAYRLKNLKGVLLKVAVNQGRLKMYHSKTSACDGQVCLYCLISLL